MTKKAKYFVLGVFVVLVGLFFLSQSGHWLTASDSTRPTSTTQQRDNVSNLALRSEPAIAISQSNLRSELNESAIKGMATGALMSEMVRRKESWRRMENAHSLEQSISALLNDSDIESPMFALHLKLICGNATFFTSKDNPAKITYQEYLRGMNTGLTEEGIAKANALQEAFASRCGRAGETLFLSDEMRAAIQKSKSEGGALALSFSSASSLDGIKTAGQLAALTKVLRNPDLAPIWLTQKFFLFTETAKNAGYFEGLTIDEERAVGWTVICNFGADCSDGGATRFYACRQSYFCSGGSVAESIKNLLGEDKIIIVTARANKLALDLAAGGADFFKLPLKK